MKYCRYCGKELLNEAAICPGCGCPAEDQSTPAFTPAPQKEKKKISKKVIILASVGAFILILGILALMIFPRPNLEMDDLCHIPSSYVGCLFDFGVPSGSNSELIKYENCLELYGIPLTHFTVYPDENQYVIFMFDESSAEALGEKLVKECDYEGSVGGLYYEFSYKNLDITAKTDFSYISIEVN